MSTSTRSRAIDAVLADADVDTPVRIMSMTKPVVTVAALHLAEQRKLDIDAPVEEYCPEFAAIGLLERIEHGRPIVRRPARKVTVKQLITHTSGLGYWFWNAEVLAWEQTVGAPKPMSGRRAGSGGWMGLFNTFFWVDPVAGVAGALYTQALPFLVPEATSLAEEFETALYASL